MGLGAKGPPYGRKGVISLKLHQEISFICICIHRWSFNFLTPCYYLCCVKIMKVIENCILSLHCSVSAWCCQTLWPYYICLCVFLLVKLGENSPVSARPLCVQLQHNLSSWVRKTIWYLWPPSFSLWKTKKKMGFQWKQIVLFCPHNSRQVLQWKCIISHRDVVQEEGWTVVFVNSPGNETH